MKLIREVNSTQMRLISGNEICSYFMCLNVRCVKYIQHDKQMQCVRYKVLYRAGSQ